MIVGVVNEVSAKGRNDDLVDAVEATGNSVINLGMSPSAEEPELTYIHTGLMAAVVLHLRLVDFVVGGCGTGQGFLNSVLAYPGVVCGAVRSVLDAELFSRINAGNCISLALNQGYGWGSALELRFIMHALFSAPSGSGYPTTRQKPQAESREQLAAISSTTRRSFKEIFALLDPAILVRVSTFPRFRKVLETSPEANRLFSVV
jgi:ribose 5-phosphate isomerase RpiB